MKTLTIDWLNKCRCGNKLHTVKTARGNESALWDDDAVKCNSCGRGGVIQVCEGQARVLWETDEEMAEGKPMSTITKEFTREQLIEHLRTRIEHRKGLIASMHIDRGYRDYLKLELRSSEIALASLEAEAVEWRVSFRLDGQPGSDFEKTFENQSKMNEIISLHERAGFSASITPLYTAPPAPVSVPDENGLLPCPFCGSPAEHYPDGDMEGYSVMCGHKNGDCISWVFGFETREEAEKAWNTRAAMLQGAEPVTTAYKLPEGWVAVPVEPTAEMYDAGDQQLATKQVWDAMIAAAPQQEVKP